MTDTAENAIREYTSISKDLIPHDLFLENETLLPPPPVSSTPPWFVVLPKSTPYPQFKKCFSRSFSTHSLNHTHTLVEETPGDVDTRKCPFEHKPCDQWTTCSSFIAATSLCYLMVMGAFNSGTRYEKFMLTLVLHDKARSRVAAHLWTQE